MSDCVTKDESVQYMRRIIADKNFAMHKEYTMCKAQSNDERWDQQLCLYFGTFCFLCQYGGGKTTASWEGEIKRRITIMNSLTLTSRQISKLD